jgi:thiol-disulfide isomerase/thioredoxin
MALTYSQDTDLGTQAPAFDLPPANPAADTIDGPTRRLADYDAADVLVVVFTCNHCPYAKHVEDALIQFSQDYASQSVQVVAINANDAEAYPDDSFLNMAERASEQSYPFPYLHDASQEVAKAYGALCTPDVFVYDVERQLAYHGRVDETRPGQGTADAADLRQAVDELLKQGTVQMEQAPSMGCNIKWKPGNQPKNQD